MRKLRSRNEFIMGAHNVISDISGQKFKSTEMRMTWDGFLVHQSEWYPRHPQLDIRGRDEQIAVSPTRPRQPDKFFVPTADDL